MENKLNFTQYAKNELLSNLPENSCCRLAWLSAAIKAIGSLQLSKKGVSLFFESANYDYVKSIVQFIKNLYFASLDIEIKDIKSGLQKGKHFMVKVPSGHTLTILTDTGIIKDEESGGFEINGGINPKMVFEECCAKNFLKSMFIALGSANVPTKIIGEDDDVESSGNGYYLEYQLSDELLSEDLVKLLEHFDISAKLTERNNKYVVYVKENEAISNFFALLSANETVLYMQDIIVERLLNNNLNRKSNCEVGNYDKTAIASSKQTIAINHIAETIGLHKLPDKLRILSELRLRNPTAPLDFFVENIGEEITKSGINHRFRKIISISDSLKDLEGK
ncbi:MAG: DNA-binding protein WhiA [Clostridia bacterium]